MTQPDGKRKRASRPTGSPRSEALEPPRKNRGLLILSVLLLTVWSLFLLVMASG